MNRKLQQLALHLIICGVGILVLVPFAFALNNSFRSNNEIYHDFFGVPASFRHMFRTGLASFAGGEPKTAGEVDVADMILEAQPVTLVESGGKRYLQYRLNQAEVVKEKTLETSRIWYTTQEGVKEYYHEVGNLLGETSGRIGVVDQDSKFRLATLRETAGRRSLQFDGEEVRILEEQTIPNAHYLLTTRDGVESVLRISQPGEAFKLYWLGATKGYRLGWAVLRGYMFNTIVVVVSVAFCVVLFGSVSAYVLSRYRFPGSTAIFYLIISTMMFPAVLTLVPAFMVVKEMGLLNTYWAMILPYVAGGQVFATFVFKGFFDGLPEELFESARIDGAGHRQIYTNLVLPLSKPIISVVVIMNIIGTWNNFMWPFVTNSDGKYHVIASGLYVMATSAYAANFSTIFSAYMVSSLPLLIVFIYATRPFIQGVTSGAFKA